MGSLQDALLKSGLAEDKPRRKVEGGHRGKPDPSAGKERVASGRKKVGKRGRNDAKSGKSDLERAWVARQRAEKEQAEREKLARVADQEARRKRNLELDSLIEGRILNQEDAEIPRYFVHLGKIRRVLCTPDQRQRINAGELGVVNLRGRYYIVEPELLAQWRELAADLVPDLSGSEPEGEEGDEYPPVPDELSW